ncbi:MAG TPA: cysteine desulfurase family protein [Longimicrobiales bacterium]|nr:cysteine desulfurase family protein [Longimicrobiales bacterium]
MDPIYLDYAATTPMRDEVLEAMAPYHRTAFGNPSSSHRWGREARAALERARGRIADALGARRREIVFVRGGTESDNLALFGRADATRRARETPCVVVSAIEHKAVLDAAHAIEAEGGRAIILPVDRAGTVQLDRLDAALEDAPCVVSVMWVNNEVGVVQPMRDIVARCAAHEVVVHSDGVQALGKIPVRLDEVRIDLLSLTGHKIYGPKSAGILFVREGTDLHARLHGGGQEAGLRPGTQDVAGAVGLAEAVCLAVAEQETASTRYAELRTRLLTRLRRDLPDLREHAEGGRTAGHILSMGIPDVDPEMLMISMDMEGVAVSGGSACQTGSNSVSHVLDAMYGDDVHPAVIRYSFGRETTDEQIDAAAAATVRVVGRLRGSTVPA